MILAALADLSDPIWHTPTGLPRQNKATALNARSYRDGARILARLAPMRSITRSRFATLGEAHQASAQLAEARAADLFNEGAQALWGRPWQPTDYVVSGIGRHEFPEALKCQLREASTATWRHQFAAGVMRHLARYYGCRDTVCRCDNC